MLTMRLASTVLGLAALSGLSFPATPSRAAEVKVEADLGQTVLDTRSSDRIYLRLSLKSAAAKARDKRSPVNVALVIDRSGSMTGRPHRRGQEGRSCGARAPVVGRHRLARVLQPRGRPAGAGRACRRLARQARTRHREAHGRRHDGALCGRQGRRRAGEGVPLGYQGQPRDPAVGRSCQRGSVVAARAGGART